MDDDRMDDAPAESKVPDRAPDRLAALIWDRFPFFMAVPSDDDDLDATARKVRTLADAVANGCEITLSPAQDTLPGRRDVEDFAKERMLAVEREHYELWKKGAIQLPPFDWDANKLQLHKNQKPENFYGRMAAMDIIWNHQGTTPENVIWLSNNIRSMLPLVKAVEKMLGAHAHLEQCDPLAKFSDQEVAEIQSLQFISAVVDANVAREKARFQQLVASINASQEKLKARLKWFDK
ncbi:hypothetical protein N7532_004511 [Penicillium argentinense]|uniref:Uncharacterized protein n=1 Tax=Penicillium argentinense TaxID=1131581 RepID=A0A9W9KG77_9EURO|nr:uncharacterized protein N7532_004511 [Penicillium argentinense]KAJ5103982.1 hypothetical protein N7532_004511 [Penicillium argentinense]